MSSQISFTKLMSEKIIVRGKEVFVGLDVHNKQWTLNIRAEQTERFHAVIPPKYPNRRQDLMQVRLQQCRISKCSWPSGRLTACGLVSDNPVLSVVDLRSCFPLACLAGTAQYVICSFARRSPRHPYRTTAYILAQLLGVSCMPFRGQRQNR